MAGMINCMRFRPKEGQAEALFKAFAEYARDNSLSRMRMARRFILFLGPL